MQDIAILYYSTTDLHDAGVSSTYYCTTELHHAGVSYPIEQQIFLMQELAILSYNRSS